MAKIDFHTVFTYEVARALWNTRFTGRETFRVLDKEECDTILFLEIIENILESKAAI